MRGSLSLVQLAKTHALLAGRNYASPHDVKSIAPDVLRHRIVPTYEAEAEGRTTDELGVGDPRPRRGALTLAHRTRMNGNGHRCGTRLPVLG